jgi:hypothetical protein
MIIRRPEKGVNTCSGHFFARTKNIVLQQGGQKNGFV